MINKVHKNSEPLMDDNKKLYKVGKKKNAKQCTRKAGQTTENATTQIRCIYNQNVVPVTP